MHPMTTKVLREMRFFRNHYLCDACPNEWSDEMTVVGTSYCPCCERAAEPYDSEPIIEAIEALIEAQEAAGFPLHDSDIEDMMNPMGRV
jgi:hypothetical protein